MDPEIKAPLTTVGEQLLTQRSTALEFNVETEKQIINERLVADKSIGDVIYGKEIGRRTVLAADLNIRKTFTNNMDGKMDGPFDIFDSNGCLEYSGSYCNGKGITFIRKFSNNCIYEWKLEGLVGSPLIESYVNSIISTDETIYFNTNANYCAEGRALRIANNKQNYVYYENGCQIPYWRYLWNSFIVSTANWFWRILGWK